MEIEKPVQTGRIGTLRNHLGLMPWRQLLYCQSTPGRAESSILGCGKVQLGGAGNSFGTLEIAALASGELTFRLVVGTHDLLFRGPRQRIVGNDRQLRG